MMMQCGKTQSHNDYPISPISQQWLGVILDKPMASGT